MDLHRRRQSRVARNLAAGSGMAGVSRRALGPRVLLVEDNAVNADMLRRRLVRRGFVVSVVDDGRIAVETAGREQPDLILMDIGLPTMCGLEVTRRLKANAATASIPVIALTAHAMASDREMALAAGCQEFETKPIDLERLVAKMQAFLSAGVSA